MILRVIHFLRLTGSWSKHAQKLFVIFLLGRGFFFKARRRAETIDKLSGGGLSSLHKTPLDSLKLSKRKGVVLFGCLAAASTLRLVWRRGRSFPSRHISSGKHISPTLQYVMEQGNSFCVKKSANNVGKSPRVDAFKLLWSARDALGTTSVYF